MTPWPGSALTIEQAADIVEAFGSRRNRFPDEDWKDAMMVVLFNCGEQYTQVTCVGPESWTGTKSELLPREGVPLCPNGHPLMESMDKLQLGWVQR